METGLFGLIVSRSTSGSLAKYSRRSVAGSCCTRIQLLSWRARLVTMLTRLNFESACSSSTSRSPNTDLLIIERMIPFPVSVVLLRRFDPLDRVVGIPVDAKAFGLQDCVQVPHGLLRTVLRVDDDVVETADELHLLLRDLEPARDLLVRLGTAGEQTLAQIREPIRNEKDQYGIGIRRLDRERAVDLRLQDDVVAFGQGSLDVIAWRSVKVAVVLAPLQETVAA